MKKPLYILAAQPLEKSRINKIFEGGDNSVIELLRNPGELRYAGWSLETLDNPRIIKGEYLEVNNGDRKILQLYEDGTFIFRCSADGEFLGWPRHGDEFYKKPRLNPMAIIEATYCYVDFYKKLISHFAETPGSIKFQLRFKDIIFENTKIYLIPFALNTYGWMFEDEQAPAPDNCMTKEQIVSCDDIVKNPSHVAYLLIRLVFLWFGVQESKIPYTKRDDSDKPIVDIEKIINSKG